MMKPFVLLCGLAACSAPAPFPIFPLPPWLQSTPATFESMQPTTLAALLTDAPVSTAGWSRVVHGPTACVGIGTNPEVLVDPPREPRAGQPWRVHWSTRSGTTAMPVEATVLLVSLLPTVQQVDLGPYGALGCWLLVNRDYALTPTWQLVSPGPNDPFFQQGGEIFWVQVLPASFAGITLRCQLVVRAIGANAAGYLLSPMLEVHVGS